MERFTTSFDASKSLTEAARTRIRDVENVELPSDFVEEMVPRYLSNATLGVPPRLFPGATIQATDIARWIKDTKFFVHVCNARLTDIETAHRNSLQEGKAFIGQAEQELSRLRSDAAELELKANYGLKHIHHNAFTREQDGELGGTRFSFDWKTNRPIDAESICYVAPGAGLTSPIESEVSIPVRSIRIVREASTVGETGIPIVESDPLSMITPDRVFRYQVAVPEYDEADHVLVRQAATFSFVAEFSMLTAINKIELKSASNVPFEITAIKYIDEAGTEQTLSATVTLIDGKYTILFELTSMLAISFTLRQQGVVSRGKITVKDDLRTELNDYLRSAGWVQRFDTVSQEIYGAIFDFSIEALEFHVTRYKPIGLFRSKPIPVTSLKGIGLTVNNESVEVGPSGGTLQERYLVIDKLDKSGMPLGNLFAPIPDALKMQSEYLVYDGRVMKVKLFPDMRATLVTVEVQSVATAGLTATVTTKTAHGLLTGDQVGFYGREELSGYYPVTVTSPTAFQITVTSAVTIVPQDSPKAYVFKQTFAAPCSVYENSTLLTIGTDYFVSIDGGETWLSAWPVTSRHESSYRNAEAGKFMILPTSVKLDRSYWIQYPVLPNQKLEPTGEIRLRNRRIMANIDKGLLSIVLLNRAELDDPYSTILTKNYTLRVISA